MNMNDYGKYFGRITLGKAGFFVKVGLFAVTVCLLITSFTLFMEYKRLGEAQALIEERIEKAGVRVAELRYEIDAPMDEEYIKRVARSELELVLPDEIVYYTDIPKQ